MHIYIERVIGVMKTEVLYFTFYTSNQHYIASSDNDGVSFIDKIVTICCALCNCSDSVVPFK